MIFIKENNLLKRGEFMKNGIIIGAGLASEKILDEILKTK